MIETALHSFLLDVPHAAAIWLLLLAFAGLALAGMLVKPRPHRRDVDERIRESVRRRARAAAEAVQAHRYAEEVAVASTRATAAAEHRRRDWLTAQDRAEAAWSAYDAAEDAARKLAAAASMPVPHTPQTPAAYADRQRYLHRAAMAACWRQEISVLDLSDVLAGRNGWDPRRHPAEQEVILRRFVRDRARAAWLEAQRTEQAAWHAAEMAAVAAASLRAEERAAAERAATLAVRRPVLAAAPAPAGRPVMRPSPRWRPARAG